MKGAVAMEIWLSKCQCRVSLYFRNRATRKARLQLSAIAKSSAQSRSRATGNSVWLGIERYAALFNHGTRQDFTFSCDNCESADLTIPFFVRNLGLSIAQNANLVECLRMGVKENPSRLHLLRVDVDSQQLKKDIIFAQLFSLDVWKDAFPSLQRAYLIGFFCNVIDVSPQLMKHVRGMEQCMKPKTISPAYLDCFGSMIRNNVIEEVDFLCHLLNQPKMLDDALRRVRSFRVDIESRTSWDRFAMSLERTKAEGDKLECVRVNVCRKNLLDVESLGPTAVETILRLRPNLQVLEVRMLDGPRFIQVCQAVTSSTLTKFMCWCLPKSSMRVEAAVAVVGELLQHSTIRDLQLCIFTDDHSNHFVQGIAEGLRTTRLRRFHLVTAFGRVSIGSMTKLYESVRENRSLLDIQLKGGFWRLWRFQCHHDLPHAPPCPFSFFEFLSSRNQYLSQLLMPYDFPVGLWPLILESASGDAAILYSLLTSQPHLIRVRSS